MTMTVDEVLVEANGLIEEMGVQVPEASRAGQWIDLRTFRHYRNQGLVDPPNEKRGTRGLYGESHVWQLVAIKAMQARWIPLAEIRSKLADASIEALNAIVGQPETPEKRPTSQHRIRTDQATRRWIEVRLADDAYAMVSPDWLGKARPSALHAIGERLVTLLLAERGRLHG